MTPEERDKKIETFLKIIKFQRDTAANHEREMKNYQGMAEHEFTLLASICPGRSEPSDGPFSWNAHRGRCWCDATGSDYCEFKNCPMVHKGQRFDWGEGDASN